MCRQDERIGTTNICCLEHIANISLTLTVREIDFVWIWTPMLDLIPSDVYIKEAKIEKQFWQSDSVLFTSISTY